MIPHECGTGRGFVGVIDYITHDPDHAETADRVGRVTAINLDPGADLGPCEPHMVARIMAATVASAPALKATAGIKATGRKLKNPVYHVTLGWQAGYRPTDQEREAAITGALEGLGLQDHQAYAVEHTDHDHLHDHIVVNRVSPLDGRAANLHRSKAKLQEWALAFEKAHPNPHPVPGRGARTVARLEGVDAMMEVRQEAEREAARRGQEPMEAVREAARKAKDELKPGPIPEPRPRWDRTCGRKVLPLPGESQAWSKVRPEEKRELSVCLNDLRGENPYYDTGPTARRHRPPVSASTIHAEQKRRGEENPRTQLDPAVYRHDVALAAADVAARFPDLPNLKAAVRGHLETDEGPRHELHAWTGPYESRSLGPLTRKLETRVTDAATEVAARTEKPPRKTLMSRFWRVIEGDGDRVAEVVRAIMDHVQSMLQDRFGPERRHAPAAPVRLPSAEPDPPARQTEDPPSLGIARAEQTEEPKPPALPVHAQTLVEEGSPRGGLRSQGATTPATRTPDPSADREKTEDPPSLGIDRAEQTEEPKPPEVVRGLGRLAGGGVRKPGSPRGGLRSQGATTPATRTPDPSADREKQRPTR